MAFFFVFCSAVYTRYGLDGIDAANFLIKEKRMELRLVKTSLELVYDNDNSILCRLEIFNNPILCYIVIH